MLFLLLRTHQIKEGQMDSIRYVISMFFKRGLGDPFKKNTHLATHLRKCGPETVELIFDKFDELRQKGGLLVHEEERGFPVVNLAYVIRSLAEPKHLPLIENILFCDEVIREEDRSLRWSLLKTLEEIGDPAAIPIILRYKEVIKSKKYKDVIKSKDMLLPGAICNERDRLEAEEVLLYLSQRVSM
jgi:hypothetical protein